MCFGESNPLNYQRIKQMGRYRYRYNIYRLFLTGESYEYSFSLKCQLPDIFYYIQDFLHVCKIWICIPI